MENEALVVRLELPLDSARLLNGLAVQHASDVAQRLAGVLAEHTRKALDEQAENLAYALRELERGIANPASVEVPPTA